MQNTAFSIIDSKLVHFIDMVQVDNYFWFNALEWNGYYRMNIEDKKAEFLGFFEKSDIFADKLFNRVLSFQSIVFFIPWFSNYLVSLDTSTLRTKYWELPDRILPEIAKFSEAEIYDGKIYMFPHCGDDICIFDIKTEKFTCDNGWEKEYKKYVTKTENVKFLQGCKKKDSIYLPSFSGSFIMNYRLSSQNYEIIQFPEREEKMVDVTIYNENELLILSWVGNVWKYNVNNKQIQLLYQYEGEKEFPYRHILYFQKKMYLIPAKEEKIELVTTGWSYIKNYPMNWELQYMNVWIESTFYGYYKDKDKIYLCPCKGNMILQIDLKTDILNGIIILEQNILYRKRKSIKYMKEVNSFYYELKTGLKFFIYITCNRENNMKDRSFENGKKIWYSVV